MEERTKSGDCHYLSHKTFSCMYISYIKIIKNRCRQQNDLVRFVCGKLLCQAIQREIMFVVVVSYVL